MDSWGLGMTFPEDKETRWRTPSTLLIFTFVGFLQLTTPSRKRLGLGVQELHVRVRNERLRFKDASSLLIGSTNVVFPL